MGVSEAVDHPRVRIPPPILTLLHLLAAFVLGRLIPLPGPSGLRWVGFALVLLGLGLSAWAVREFVAAGTTLDPHRPASAFVTGGPYRYTRNPIYLGFVCFLIGFPLAFRSWWGILLVPAFILLMDMLVIRHEEAYLERKFERAYLDFKSRVRRWL